MKNAYSVLKILQSICNNKSSRSEVNQVIELSQRYAFSYLKYRYKNLSKILMSEDVTLQELAIDAIAPLFETDGNGLFVKIVKAFNEMTTKTFVDNDKEYLIKVLNYADVTKVFVFSTKDEVIKNFDIVIEPNNLKYHFEDNSEPLKIEQPIEASTLQLNVYD